MTQRRATAAAGLLLAAAMLAGCTTTTVSGRAEPAGSGTPVATPPPSAAPSSAPSSAPPASPSRPPHVLTFEVTGNATVRISYVVDGRTTRETPRLPWRRSINLAADAAHEWSLTIEHDSGQVSALQTVDGQPFGQSAGSGGGRVRLSGNIRP